MADQRRAYYEIREKTHEKSKRLGSIEYIGTQTFDKRLDHYISNRPKRLWEF